MFMVEMLIVFPSSALCRTAKHLTREGGLFQVLSRRIYSRVGGKIRTLFALVEQFLSFGSFEYFEVGCGIRAGRRPYAHGKTTKKDEAVRGEDEENRRDHLSVSRTDEHLAISINKGALPLPESQAEIGWNWTSKGQ